MPEKLITRLLGTLGYLGRYSLTAESKDATWGGGERHRHPGGKRCPPRWLALCCRCPAPWGPAGACGQTCSWPVQTPSHLTGALQGPWPHTKKPRFLAHLDREPDTSKGQTRVPNLIARTLHLATLQLHLSLLLPTFPCSHPSIKVRFDLWPASISCTEPCSGS